MKKIDLINGNIPKSLLLFALPNILTYFATYLYYAVDIFVLSLSGAEEEISAVMSGLTPVTLATSLIIGVSVGGTFLVGQYHGAKDIEGRRKAIMSFGIFLLSFSIVLAIIIASFSPLIISWLNVEESLRDQSIRYLALATISIPFTGLTYFINAVYKGCGKSVFPFIYTGGGIFLNLIFDFIFVYALGLKSDGAAIALILSFVVSSALAVTWVIFKEKGLKRIGRPTLDMQNIKRIIKFGLPLSIQESIVTVCFIVLVSCMNIRGADVSNALAISDRITNITYAASLGISNALCAAIAQNLGAYKIDRCKKFMKWGMIFTLISIIIFALPIYFSSYYIAGLYTSNEEIKTMVFQRGFIIVIDLFLCVLLSPLLAMQSGSGHSLNSMLTYLIPDIVVRIPLTLILSFTNQSFVLVSIAYPISTVLCILLAYYFYKKGSWKNLKALPVTQDIYKENQL